MKLSRQPSISVCAPRFFAYLSGCSRLHVIILIASIPRRMTCGSFFWSCSRVPRRHTAGGSGLIAKKRPGLDDPGAVFTEDWRLELLHLDELELGRKGAKQFADSLSSGEDLEAVIADGRYNYISEKLSCVKAVKSDKSALTGSDKIDRVLTHRIWAIPIFAVILFFVFHLTFSENLFFLNGFTDKMGWMPSLVDLGTFRRPWRRGAGIQ